VDKIVISHDELTESPLEAPQAPSPRVEAKLPPPISWLTRILLAPLVLVLPLLCLVTIILRVAFRSQSPRIRHAWTGYLATLLIISGFLTSLATVLVFSLGPIPAIVSSGLSELDERIEYPKLPSISQLSGSDVSRQLKSLVAVISPTAQSFFGKREMLSTSFGAGMLIEAGSTGYLFATARHVVGDYSQIAQKTPHAMVSLESGVWATAEVVAVNRNLDVALIWVPRHAGEGSFVQPIAPAKQGEDIYVIGHPEGLKFTLSVGIVSRTENNLLQVSAPISPGNSGGPVYDKQGNLVGIVSYTMDKSLRPNAENLNFAVSANTLLRESDWEFSPDGRERLQEFWQKSRGPATGQNDAKSSDRSATP
jgi:S1-C subfamily serine protease